MRDEAFHSFRGRFFQRRPLSLQEVEDPSSSDVVVTSVLTSDGHALIGAASTAAAASVVVTPSSGGGPPLISPTISPSSFDSLLTPAGSPEDDGLEPWIQTV